MDFNINKALDEQEVRIQEQSIFFMKEKETDLWNLIE